MRIDILRYFLYLGLFSVYKTILPDQIVILSWLISLHPCEVSPSVAGLLLYCPSTFMSTTVNGSCSNSFLISCFSFCLTGIILSLFLNFLLVLLCHKFAVPCSSVFKYFVFCVQLFLWWCSLDFSFHIINALMTHS